MTVEEMVSCMVAFVGLALMVLGWIRLLLWSNKIRRAHGSIETGLYAVSVILLFFAPVGALVGLCIILSDFDRQPVDPFQ